MTDNLKLWNAIGTTDPAYTKAFNQGFSGTSINSTYLVMKATEQWGLIGFGWGYEIKDERIDTGAAYFNDENQEVGNLKTHTILLSLWVKQGDAIGRVEHYGHTPYIYRANSGKWITDQEAPKKSLTDALKKCLSMFGFSADIFLGLYDDQNYVAEVKAQADIDKSDDKAAEILKQRQEYETILSKNINFMATATNMNELECLYTSITRKANHRNDKAGLKLILKTKDKRKLELDKKDD